MPCGVATADRSLDEAGDLQTASCEAIYTSEARGSDESGWLTIIDLV